MQPLISIIIVNWNWKKWLQKCLDSLISQTYKNLEIIIVDNKSTDDSVEYIHKNYPQVNVVLSEKNGGFAYWNNLWIKNAKGEYILMLNNDTWVSSDFVESMYQKFQLYSCDILAPTEGAYSGDIPEMKTILTIDIFGYPILIKDKSNNLVTDKNLFVSWACILFRKDYYQKTLGMDNEFFMYFEETDWMWRINIFWWKILKLYDVYFYHAGWGSSVSRRLSADKFLWRNENTLQMLLKNYSLWMLIFVLPIYFLINFIEAIIFLCIGKFSIAFTYISWPVSVFRKLNRVFKNRKVIQNMRKKNDLYILSKMYFWFAKINHLFQFIKR